MKLLYHIMAHILILKMDGFDFIIERELMIMTTLAWRIVVNLPEIMVHQMQEAATSRPLCLPYGMGLTRVFYAFGISLEGKAFNEILHMDIYDDWSLLRMGYQKVEGRWIRRG